MKVVIDIDKNLYTRLFDNGVDNYDDAVDMAKAIRKGTPLPKNHGRLIDVSEYFNKEFGDAREFLDKATTIITEESEEEE